MSTAKRIEIGGITGWLLPALILAGWEAAARAGLISANVLPAPSAVAEAFG
jgi:sulfonate transport system permease protein